MSAFGDLLSGIKEALRLADDVRRLGKDCDLVAADLRDHDRRITRLEARWQTAVELVAARSGIRRLDENE